MKKSLSALLVALATVAAVSGIATASSAKPTGMNDKNIVQVAASNPQFSTLVTRVVEPHAIGTALTLQTSVGFLLTSVTVQLVPVVATYLGWRYAFPVLALGPALGIAAIRRLRA